MSAVLSDDFARFNLEPHAVREWEDGARIEEVAGAYEWWYFDAHLDDGAKVTVVFLALSPPLWVHVERTDGTNRLGDHERRAAWPRRGAAVHAGVSGAHRR